MGFVNAFGTVSRRGGWRRRIHFWDDAANAPHDISEATLSLAVYVADPRAPHASATPVCGPSCHAVPILVAASDDLSGFIVPDGANHARLNVPQARIAALRPGIYCVTIAAAYADGSIVAVLEDLVVIAGHDLVTVFRQPLTADTALTADSGLPVNAPLPGLL